MLRCEIIRTCSHEKVAEAAVLSIGPDFRDRVAVLAAASGARPGAFVADLVRRFPDETCDGDLEAFTRAIAGSDMPILEGLRFIVEFMIDDEPGASGRTRATRRTSGFRRNEGCARAA